jgi:type II secretion system protein D
MHRLSLLRTFCSFTSRASLLIAAPFFFACSTLTAQLRQDAVKAPPTKTSPSAFRPLSSQPLDERAGEKKNLVAQNAPAPQPAPPTVAPVPGAPATPTTPTVPAGPGGFGARPRGGFGGFATPNADAETFKIEGDKVSLQFPNNAISDILGIYERLTNKTLVKDTAIFEGQTISLMTPVPVEKAEAIKLIEAALLTNGYAIVADPDGKSARILSTKSTSGTSGGHFSQGVMFYQSARDLPDNETIVSYFMALTHLDPTEAATMLGGHIGLNPYGRITPVSSPPGLLITETANIVKQLVSIKEVIDSPATASSLVTKFVPLKYADAATVAQIVQATLDAQAQERETKGITTIRGQNTVSERGDRNDNNSRAPTPQPQVVVRENGVSKLVEPKIKASSQVVADTRLNQLLVVAEADDFAYIASLIAEFDKPVNVPVPYERKLKNIYSIDVIAVLADLLKEAAGGATQLPGGGTLSERQQALTTSSNSFLTGRNGTNTRGGTFSTSGAASTSTSTTGGGVSSRPDMLVEAEQDNAPISVLVNKTRVIADPLANSIIVIGPKEDQDKVDMLLDTLDRKSPQVYLATVIGQLTLGDGFQFGIDYLQHFTSIGANSGVASALVVTRDASGDSIVAGKNVADMTNNLITTSIANTKGFNVYGQIGEAVDTFVSALETSSDFKVLSRPSVFALNNKKAVITSGQSIPVPTSTLTNAASQNAANNGNVTTTIEYKDVVLKLEVIPLINPDGEVTLKVAQVNDTVIGQQVVAQNSVPIIGTEQLTTTVTVPTGHTIVIGGLISEQFKTDTEGIPILGRIPYLGRLFREDITSKERKELIIFIQPMVVDSEFAMRQASMNEDLRTKAGEYAARSFPEKLIPRAEPVEGKVAARARRWFDIFKRPERPQVEVVVPPPAPAPMPVPVYKK